LPFSNKLNWFGLPIEGVTRHAAFELHSACCAAAATISHQSAALQINVR